jgi:hypothetical protein
MERSDLPDKLFAEDTLSYPNSVDGERPADEDRQVSAQQGTRGDTASGGNAPTEDMLAVEYREDEVQTAADPLEHTPSPEDKVTKR